MVVLRTQSEMETESAVCKEQPYKFQSLEKLWHDFTGDVRKYREGKR